MMENNNHLPDDKSVRNNYTLSVMAFTMLQLTIFYTNRGQIMYLTTRQYGIFYVTIFSCLYPLGLACGSILNQYLILRLGRREAYIILFAVVSISLLANNIYNNKFSWWLFRFSYSFAISGLISIFDSGLETAINQSKRVLPKSVVNTSSSRAGNLISGILLSAWRLEYFQVVTISAILLQISQIFFTLTQELPRDLPQIKAKYMPKVFVDIYEQDKSTILSFICMNGIYGVYLTWILIITSHVSLNSFVLRFLVLFFVMGEIISCYLFSKIENSPSLKINIARDTTFFALINIFLFWFLHYSYHKLFLIFLCISGGLINKIVSQTDVLMSSYHTHFLKKEMDLTYLITRQFLNIAVVIITLPFVMYKSQFVIVVILFLCLMNSICLTWKRSSSSLIL